MTTITRIAPDNAAYAWANCRQACLAALPADFVHDYRTQLDAAAVTAMAMTLPEAWAATGLGYEMKPVSEVEMGSPYGPHDGIEPEWYWLAWDRAADAIDAEALVLAADLGAELASYRDDEPVDFDR